MTFGVRLLDHLYAGLLRLYPRSFRTEFGAEMRAVFAESVAGAAARGWTVLVGFLLRELHDWPGALLRAHWRSLSQKRRRGEHMENVVVSSDNASVLEERHAPAPWREALLAGLPHALMALTLGATMVAPAYGVLPFSGQGILVIRMVAGVAFAISMVGAMAIAWRRGWPRWSASWFGYAFPLLAVPLGSALQAWNLPASSWRLKLLLPGAYSRLLLPLLLALMLCALGLRNRLKLLLAVLPLLLLLWMPALEFSLYSIRTLVMLGAWLGAALVAVLMARAARVRTGVWMALVLGLAVGLAYTYVRTYHAQLPPDAPAHYRLPPTPLDWLNLFAPGMLATGVVVLEPLLVRGLWVWGQRGGPMGALGFRVSLVGLMLLLAADLTAYWYFVTSSGVIKLVWGYQAAGGLWLSVLAYLAILCYGSGLILLGVAVVRAGLSSAEVGALFLAFVLIVIPVLAALPIVYGWWDVRTIPKIWMYLVGLPWLSLGTWLITRRSAGRVSRAAA